MANLLLLIDGNNLAHFLYTNLAPRQKMTPTDSLRLIEHISSYARTYAGQVEVELCLDRSPGPFPEISEALRVFSAEYPQTGDDLVTGRFWFHQLHGSGCLVITNDEEILEEVEGAGGSWLRVSDFVRRPGLKDPVLRDPADLPPAAPPAPQPESSRHPLSESIYYRIVEDQRLNGATQTAKTPTAVPGKPVVKKLPAREASIPSVPHFLDAPAVEESGASRLDTQPVKANPAPEAYAGDYTQETCSSEGEPEGASAAEPYYFLNLDAWPLVEGARFLIKSFCDHHQDEVADLLGMLDTESVARRDLRDLAELLLLKCGDEPDFAQRGALLARVRLALLQARGDPLSLTQIAGRTGFKAHGLRGRIKAKASPWVEILAS